MIEIVTSWVQFPLFWLEIERRLSKIGLLLETIEIDGVSFILLLIGVKSLMRKIKVKILPFRVSKHRPLNDTFFLIRQRRQIAPFARILKTKLPFLISRVWIIATIRS